jgi:hypothetical protein
MVGWISVALSIAACCKFIVWFCLCLHDALNFQAAAAMCVGMGSFTDPPNAQGLAHFLGMQSLPSLSYLSRTMDDHMHRLELKTIKPSV